MKACFFFLSWTTNFVTGGQVDNCSSFLDNVEGPYKKKTKLKIFQNLLLNFSEVIKEVIKENLMIHLFKQSPY